MVPSNDHRPARSSRTTWADDGDIEQLLTHFDRLMQTPESVQRLRRFILDLAVRGKLVPQDPADEPAFISSIEKKQRKSQQALPADIPGWLVAPVGALLEFRYGKGMKASERLIEGPVPVFGSNGIVGYCETPLTKTPSIIIGRKGSAGALNLCDGPSWTTDVAYFVEAPDFFDLHYLLIGLQTLDLGSLGKGVKPGLSRSDAYNLPLSVPPLAEQHRIVAKVDELMGLCDRLEAAQMERETTRTRLAAASLARLNAPAPDETTFREHVAFVLNNLAPMTTRPEQVKALRQTILNLAVRGKLVEQNPADEPAAELLKDIADDLYKRGTSKNQAVAPREITREEAPYTIPEIWIWVPFGHITISLDGERIPVSKEERSGRAKLYDYYGASGVIDKIDNYLFDKPLLLIGEDGANLINRSTPIAFIARGKYWVNNHAHVLDGFSEDFLRYIELFINAIDLKPYVTGTAQPKMNQTKMNSIPVALPPLAEQHRIVTKVNELMGLCDRLEASLEAGDDGRGRLLGALLHEALEPHRNHPQLTAD